MSILEVRDVSIIYSDDKRVAVEHASLDRGRRVCLHHRQQRFRQEHPCQGDCGTGACYIR